MTCKLFVNVIDYLFDEAQYFRCLSHYANVLAFRQGSSEPFNRGACCAGGLISVPHPHSFLHEVNKVLSEWSDGRSRSDKSYHPDMQFSMSMESFI